MIGENYFNSAWSIITNIPILIIFGLICYNTYAKRWSASTGKYSTIGRITWSEIYYGKNTQILNKHALISYAYSVEGKTYNGVITVSPFKMEKTVEENPKGKEVLVYYSKKDPEFSQAYKPPNHFRIIGKSFIQYFFIPFILINLFSAYFHWLINVSK